jgi:hypothetical protein
VSGTVTLPRNSFFFTSKPLISCSENALKLTYSNVEFQNFPGVIPPDAPFKRRGRGERRSGGDSWEGRWKERGGKRMGGIIGTSAP